VATRADTGEVLHARLRKGSSQRGAKRFAEELSARVRRAGATGALTVRADAWFWNYALIDTLSRLGVRWSITVRITKHIRACIDTIGAPNGPPPSSTATAGRTTTLPRGFGIIPAKLGSNAGSNRGARPDQAQPDGGP
jgi:hypothetical protein